MSEDQRVSRNPAEPDKQAPAGAQRWADYLAWVRDDMIAAVLALSPTEQRELRVPSGWSPIELLSHVLHMEQRWFVWIFLGETVAEPWGDWTVPEPWTGDDSTDPAARWHVPEGTTAEELADRLERVGRRTTEILAAHPPGARATPAADWDGSPPTLEWICFHVLQEYARHAGHLDIVAELARQNPVMPSP